MVSLRVIDHAVVISGEAIAFKRSEHAMQHRFY